MYVCVVVDVHIAYTTQQQYGTYRLADLKDRIIHPLCKRYVLYLPHAQFFVVGGFSQEIKNHELGAYVQGGTMATANVVATIKGYKKGELNSGLVMLKVGKKDIPAKQELLLHYNWAAHAWKEALQEPIIQWDNHPSFQEAFVDREMEVNIHRAKRCGDSNTLPHPSIIIPPPPHPHLYSPPPTCLPTHPPFQPAQPPNILNSLSRYCQRRGKARGDDRRGKDRSMEHRQTAVLTHAHTYNTHN
jgi:hypothetical protein